jgi:uncharacterized protein (DUF58 family)
MERGILKDGEWSLGWFLCQGYRLFILLVLAAIGPLFYSVLAWLLFTLSLFFIFRPPPLRFALTYLLATLFLLPLMLDSLSAYFVMVGSLTPLGFAVLAAALVAPLLYLLDVSLKQYAGEMAVPGESGRRLSHLSRTLLVATLTMLFLSWVIGQMAMLFTALILLGYLLVMVFRVLYRFSALPVAISGAVVRVTAGNETLAVLAVTRRMNLELRARVIPQDDWLMVAPGRFGLGKANPEVNLTFTLTPPLSGPVHPNLILSVMDGRGLVQRDQVISPLELHVIPRAKYAEWLARKYLVESGVGTTVVPISSSVRLDPERKAGIEYYQSRDYQPGDTLRDIDWKHALKLGQLIVKERIDVSERLAVIVVNLSVADAEGADKLAYRLITTALTLAREMVPVALAVYNQEKVVLTTPVSDPREILKQTLRLVKEIKPVALGQRCLKPPDIAGLSRDISRLKTVESRPARRLLELLEFEYRAVEKTARKHLATRALLRVTEPVSPPATVIMISELNHDAEALLVIGERLKKRGFGTYFMEFTRS